MLILESYAAVLDGPDGQRQPDALRRLTIIKGHRFKHLKATIDFLLVIISNLQALSRTV